MRPLPAIMTNTGKNTRCNGKTPPHREEFFGLSQQPPSLCRLCSVDGHHFVAGIGHCLAQHLVGYIGTQGHRGGFLLQVHFGAYTVDGIEDAIIRKKKIAFNYFHLNEKAERVYVTTGTGDKKRYYVEPVALIFNEDNYYLMAYSSRHPEKTASYRIDRIDHLEVVEESVLSDEALAQINGVAEFTEQAFKMYGGEAEDVVLQFDRKLVEPVFDKFGEATPMMTVNDNTCAATVHVQISPTFFGWLAQFGNKMHIISPANVIGQYQEHIKNILAVNRTGSADKETK